MKSTWRAQPSRQGLRAGPDSLARGARSNNGLLLIRRLTEKNRRGCRTTRSQPRASMIGYRSVVPTPAYGRTRYPENALGPFPALVVLRNVTVCHPMSHGRRRAFAVRRCRRFVAPVYDGSPGTRRSPSKAPFSTVARRRRRLQTDVRSSPPSASSRSGTTRPYTSYFLKNFWLITIWILLVFYGHSLWRVTCTETCDSRVI